MCSRAEVMRIACFAAISWFGLFALAGCSADHPCMPESCDGRDNDCDGHVDEGFVNTSWVPTRTSTTAAGVRHRVRGCVSHGGHDRMRRGARLDARVSNREL